jgi:hypothetical protein
MLFFIIQDFLVTDDNESSMKKILQEKELSTQMAYLLRDMQLLQQRQQEVLFIIMKWYST